MKSISAKELKNHTGQVLRWVGGGEKVLITKWGKPWAVLSPGAEAELPASSLRPYEEAWAAIEQTLSTSSPQYATWEEAMEWTRQACATCRTLARARSV